MGAASAGTPGGRRPTAHILCFEEVGDCTLERVAREAVPGDAVEMHGPADFVRRLHRFGLRDGVAVSQRNRVAGSWWLAPALGTSAIEGTAPASPDGVDAGHGFRVAYGPRAQWLTARAAQQGFAARPPFPLPDPQEAEAAPIASVPAELPPDAAAGWPEGRRARIRRELGLMPHECAVLVAGDPSEWIDLHFAARAFAMARVGGAPLRMVVSPRSARIAQMAEFLARAAHAKPIVADERADRPWELLPALDASVHDQDGVATLPLHCRGWRAISEGERALAAQPMSPLPALWSLACGKPAFVHRAIDLGAHAAHPQVHRFGDDVAQLARGLHAVASGLHAVASGLHALASSASAASR